MSIRKSQIKYGKKRTEISPLDFCSCRFDAVYSCELQGDEAMSAGLSCAVTHGGADCYDAEGRLCVTEQIQEILVL